MNRNGFTLIELSIAIVVIGLIVGGILVGRDLIQAANTRTIVKEVQSIEMAMNVFRMKYNGLPGDITNATQFWGQDTSCPSTSVHSNRRRATCNGNGNGFIRGTPSCVHGEIFRATQQLVNAGLIWGDRFTGVSGGNPSWLCGAVAVIGLNVPASKYAGVGYTIAAPAENMYCIAGSSNSFDDCIKNSLRIGGQRTDGVSIGPIFPPVMAQNIDIKLDDGKPAYGKMRARKQTDSITPNCTTSNLADTAEYNTLNNANLCSMYYRLD